jgi:hypothetical protein
MRNKLASKKKKKEKRKKKKRGRPEWSYPLNLKRI